MSVARVLGGVAASAAVAGCAVVAFGMSRSGGAPTAHASAGAFSMPASRSAHPTYAPLPSVGSSSSVAPVAVATTTVARTVPPTRPATTRLVPSTLARSTSAAPVTSARPRVTSSAPRPRATTAHPATTVRGVSLPLGFGTGTATKVITVTAHSRGSTTATLQAWRKASGGGWLKYGTAVTAHIGAQGMSWHPSESTSATPIGSFTLTQAFGYYTDPGTALPYFQTRPSDWWISQSGPLYNTHQRCSSGCAFTRGSPNEHLYYETPYYNYAVVIDYNTRNAPGGVRQGAGSAFFLHVTDGAPTAGCVAIPQSRLVPLMRWLTPTAHPRILIGTV